MHPDEPFYAVGEHFAVDLPGARAIFTTRRGGHSRGPYESLNLGLLTEDDRESVRRNRETLEAQLGAGLSFVRQVHGTCVRAIDGAAGPAGSAGPGPGAGLRGLPAADGQVTRTPGLALAALTADCLPIAVAGDGAVAMLHAGWRGLQAGVVAAGVAALRELGAAGRLAAAIGPGAGPCCYEVGAEVHDAFDRSGLPDAVHDGRNLDLKAIARGLLEGSGVSEVHDIGICTICSDPSLLFSHRRDSGVTGRQAGIAWLS